MKMTERLFYLLTILGCIGFNTYMTWWHSGHYDYLMDKLEITKQYCKKVIDLSKEGCSKNSCPL